jgi:proliferating cell nuclear antigen
MKVGMACAKMVAEEISVDVSKEDGLNIVQMDPAHVSLIEFKVPPTAFDRFDVKSPAKMAVRAEDFVKLFAVAENTDVVSMKFPGGLEDESMAVSFSSGMSNRPHTSYDMRLVSGFINHAPIPDVHLEAGFRLARPTIAKVMEKMQVVSDQVTVSCSKDGVAFSSKSDVGKALEEFKRDDPYLFGLDAVEPQTSTYSIDYITGFQTAIEKNVPNPNSLEPTFLFRFTHKKPMRIELKLDDRGSRIHYWLAPRVEG